ncbi:MAG: hypothetical protein HY744_02190 [Deltaproteobacteria bacterium]|nr:hypothetical protein [Deltaproteobacteria bacterium]
MRKPLCASLGSVLLLLGCGFGDHGPPHPLAPPEAGTAGAAAQGGGGSTTGSGAGGAAPLPEAGVLKRTVELRSPFGGPPGNLLVDGDFEFSAVPEGWHPQLGWRGFNNKPEEVNIRYETGGLCRTGLHCAVLEPGVMFFGRGTSADGTGMMASMFAKVPAGSKCQVVRAYTVGCDAMGGVAFLKRVASAPGPDGWCEYRAAIKASDSATCLVVDSTLEEDGLALVDSARLEPDTGTVPKVATTEQLSPADAARLRRTMEWIRRRTPF